jgi:hypothetical protein
MERAVFGERTQRKGSNLLCRYLFNMDHHVRSADQHDEIYVVDGGPASSVIRYINHRWALGRLFYLDFATAYARGADLSHV